MQRKDAVRVFTSQTKELHGPDGVCSPQTYRDLSVILRFPERLKKSFDYVNANYAEAFRLSFLTTLYVENFFSEMRPGNEIRTSVLLSIFILFQGSQSQSKTKYLLRHRLTSYRNWRAEYGQNVRQATVRSLTTKDKPRTLPMICYKFKPDEPQHVDFGNLKALRTSKRSLPNQINSEALFIPKVQLP